MDGDQINPITSTARSVGRIICVFLVLGVVAAILFPVFAQAKIGNGRLKPGFRALFKAQREGFSLPVDDAIAKDDLPQVQFLLRRFNTWDGYFEDPGMRYTIAKYYAHKGLLADAHKQLDLILHPPKKLRLTNVHTGGEFMSLWYTTAVGIPQQEKDRQIHYWAYSFKEPQAPEFYDLSGLAKVEYLAGMECIERAAPNQAITHFQKALQADPTNGQLKAILAGTKKQAFMSN